MSYKVPSDDINFVVRYLADLPMVLQLPGFEEFTTELCDAILEENARFVQEQIAPLNAPADRMGAQLQDGQVTTAQGFKDALAAYTASGWQGLQHPGEYGGQGLPKLLHAVVTENLNAASLAFALCPLLTDGVIEALHAAASPELKNAYIPPLIEGRWTGTMNLTEPQAGSDLALLRTRATPQPDGSYRIQGEKIFITYGEHDLSENIIHLVLARTPDAPPGVKGISLFLVPKFLVNQDGSLGARNDVWCARLEEKLGIHASPTAELLYGSGKGEVGEGGAVGYLVGEANKGLQYMFIMMNAARYAVGLQGVAVAERAWQVAQQYAHERKQGQSVTGGSDTVVIAQHPDVDRLLQTMRGLVEGSRALAYWAASAEDVARQHQDPQWAQRSQALYEFLVPVIKGFATEMSVEVTSLAMQVYGGMGYIEETGIAQLYRDARILPIYEGTTAIQANDFIGRKLLRDKGLVALSIQALVQMTLDQLQQRLAEGSLAPEQQVALKQIHQQLTASLADYGQGVKTILTEFAEHPKAAFYGSVPILMLTGTLLAGWQLARSAVLVTQVTDSNVSAEYRAQKLATAVFYSATVLPRTHSYLATIQAGTVLEQFHAQTL